MNPEQVSTIRRLYDDAKTIVTSFDYILDHREEAFFQLRKIVEKCDYIANQIEKEFNDPNS